MDAKISNLEEKNGVMTLRISNMNHTVLNSIRRTIISDIPTFVFRTFPHNENQVRIAINTSRHNNEILKQRIGCIPIHINDMEFPYKDYQVEVDKRNDEKTIQYLTTQDFKVFNKNTKQYLSDTSVKKIFPPSSITGDYIIIARLKPSLSDNLAGEHIKFEADISISTAKQDGMYNVASTCSFGGTIDPVQVKAAWNEKKKELVASHMKKDEIEFEEKNWRLLEGKRHVIKDSHDFRLESVGVFDNMRLMEMASDVLIKMYHKFIKNINTGNGIIIEPNRDSTVPNEYLITLSDEDYTLANPLIYHLYNTHYMGDKTLSFCGFKKPHPHNNIGEIRMAFTNPSDINVVAGYLAQSAEACINIYTNFKTNFTRDE